MQLLSQIRHPTKCQIQNQTQTPIRILTRIQTPIQSRLGMSQIQTALLAQ
jgi:hypothetical protein